MTKPKDTCIWCSCDPCVPWCVRAVRGDSIPWRHDPHDPAIREHIASTKQRAVVADYRGKDSGD